VSCSEPCFTMTIIRRNQLQFSVCQPYRSGVDSRMIDPSFPAFHRFRGLLLQNCLCLTLPISHLLSV
jgi:hypothetical protein